MLNLKVSKPPNPTLSSKELPVFHIARSVESPKFTILKVSDGMCVSLGKFK